MGFGPGEGDPPEEETFDPERSAFATDEERRQAWEATARRSSTRPNTHARPWAAKRYGE
jgi:hypothetical protein